MNTNKAQIGIYRRLTPRLKPAVQRAPLCFQRFNYRDSRRRMTDKRRNAAPGKRHFSPPASSLSRSRGARSCVVIRGLIKQKRLLVSRLSSSRDCTAWINKWLLRAWKSIMAYSDRPHALPVTGVGLFGHRFVETEQESVPRDVLFKRNVLILISRFAQVAASLAITMRFSDGTHAML